MTASIAPSDTIIAPSADSSASRFCGGVWAVSALAIRLVY